MVMNNNHNIIPMPSKKLMAMVKQLTFDPLQEKPDPAQLEAVRATEPGGMEMSDAVIEKLERLQRYEARFPDLATMFKRLVQEKVAVEAVLKASTPLEDLSDVEALDSHLQNMTQKSEISMQEIKRLTDELREAAKIKDVYALESESQSEMIENLQDQLVSKSEEIQCLKRQAATTASKDSKNTTDPDAPTKETVERQQQRIAQLEEKIKSLENQLTVDNSSTSSLSLATATSDPLSDPLSASVSVPETATASATASGATTPILSKDKKTVAKEQKRDQALRDLMARLEAVLKEKKLAQQEQEATEVKLLQLQLDLDKEVKIKKEIQQFNQEGAATAATVDESGSNAGKDAKAKAREGTGDCHSGDQGGKGITAESAAKREAEAVKAKEQVLQKESAVLAAKSKAEALLAKTRAAQKALKDSSAVNEKELKIAKAQIKELQKLEATFQESKKQ
ncbi:hypothetical protein BGZ65_000307 [Modicella reniformis]|uniref:Uncharacterized protein n=1 Tax=Modicella reniformis TaxID=1440133 RepID=A0A9P6ILV6_9FUNG|nr:hypothetical protein BGZ65_000307 [Modicella reniformis]